MRIKKQLNWLFTQYRFFFLRIFKNQTSITVTAIQKLGLSVKELNSNYDIWRTVGYFWILSWCRRSRLGISHCADRVVSVIAKVDEEKQSVVVSSKLWQLITLGNVSLITCLTVIQCGENFLEYRSSKKVRPNPHLLDRNITMKTTYYVLVIIGIISHIMPA